VPGGSARYLRHQSCRGDLQPRRLHIGLPCGSLLGWLHARCPTAANMDSKVGSSSMRFVLQRVPSSCLDQKLVSS
jgi:hypothetical protein